VKKREITDSASREEDSHQKDESPQTETGKEDNWETVPKRKANKKLARVTPDVVIVKIAEKNVYT